MPGHMRKVVRLVIRGGLNSLNEVTIRRQAKLAEQRLGLMGISTVAVFDDETLESVWASHINLASRNVVWTGDPDTLTGLGFALRQTGEDPHHYTLVLPDLTDSTLAALRVHMHKEQR